MRSDRTGSSALSVPEDFRHKGLGTHLLARLIHDDRV